MTPEEAIDVLQEKISPCVTGKWKEAVDVAISALKARDSETRKICNTCKHDPPSKKWPCVDCDMREPADRWEPQEEKHSTELSLTQNGLDTISRQAAIDVCNIAIDLWQGQLGEGIVIAVRKKIEELPSAQPEIATCYGYDTNELIAFAQVCRKNGIGDTDLKDFVRNYANAWELAFRNYEEYLHRRLEKVMEGIGGDTNE